LLVNVWYFSILVVGQRTRARCIVLLPTLLAALSMTLHRIRCSWACFRHSGFVCCVDGNDFFLTSFPITVFSLIDLIFLCLCLLFWRALSRLS
jgi:hypothetical protein